MNHAPLGPLTSIQLSDYERYGFAVVRKVFDCDWITAMLGEVVDICHKPSIYSCHHKESDDTGHFLIDILMHHRSEVLSKLAFNSPALVVAAHFLRTDRFFFFYDQLFVKHPNTTTRTQWHQDLPYWPLGGTSIPSIWIALTETDKGRSAVQYLPGSHKTSLLYEPVNFSEREAARAAGRLICPDFHLQDAERSIVTNFLSPGDVVVHHPLVIHGTGPNLSSKMRAAISLRYCTPDTTWAPRPNTMYFPGTSELKKGTRFSDQNIFRACHASQLT